MKKYFLNVGTAQQGPFDLDELKSKNLTAETPVWYEGLPEWTTAGKVEELKDIFIPAIPAATVPAEDAKPVVTVTNEPIATGTIAPAPVMAKTTPSVITGKKSTAWLSWVLSLLVLGGVGYLVYDDMQKNKTGSVETTGTEITTDSTSASQTGINESPINDTTTSPVPTTTTADTGTAVIMEPLPETTTPTTTIPTTTTVKLNPAQQTAAQKEAAKKAEVQKKKQLAIQAQKKAEEEKKRIQLAQAEAAAREMEMRNNWPKYITFGKLNYQTKGDGISAFDVPVYNGTNALLEKVTVRIEYLKKEKKIFKTETIVINNIPPKSVLNGVAPESKKGEKVNVYITGVYSRKLHLCFPQNNGNPADPYFCN